MSFECNECNTGDGETTGFVPNCENSNPDELGSIGSVCPICDCSTTSPSSYPDEPVECDCECCPVSSLLYISTASATSCVNGKSFPLVYDTDNERWEGVSDYYAAPHTDCRLHAILTCDTSGDSPVWYINFGFNEIFSATSAMTVNCDPLEILFTTGAALSPCCDGDSYSVVLTVTE